MIYRHLLLLFFFLISFLQILAQDDKKTYYLRNGQILQVHKADNREFLLNRDGDVIALTPQNGRYIVDINKGVVKEITQTAYKILDTEGCTLFSSVVPDGYDCTPIIWIDGIYVNTRKKASNESEIRDLEGNIICNYNNYIHPTRFGFEDNNGKIIKNEKTKNYEIACSLLNKGKWQESMNFIEPFVRDSITWAVYLKGHLLRYGNSKYIKDTKLSYQCKDEDDKEEGLKLLSCAINKGSIIAFCEIFEENLKNNPSLIEKEDLLYLEWVQQVFGDFIPGVNTNLGEMIFKCYNEGYGTNKDYLTIYDKCTLYKSNIEILDKQRFVQKETRIVNEFLNLPIEDRVKLYPNIVTSSDMLKKAISEYEENPKSSSVFFWITCAARLDQNPDALYFISELLLNGEIISTPTDSHKDAYKYWLNLAIEKGSEDAKIALENLKVAEENERIKQQQLIEARRARRTQIIAAIFTGIANASIEISSAITEYQKTKYSSINARMNSSKEIKNIRTHSIKEAENDDDEEDEIDHTGHKHGPKGHGKVCRYCHSSGKCEQCGGDGMFDDNEFGNGKDLKKCSSCHGSGDCPHCDGHGYTNCHHEND